MRRSMQPVFAERSLVSCSLMMWLWFKLSAYRIETPGNYPKKKTYYKFDLRIRYKLWWVNPNKMKFT